MIAYVLLVIIWAAWCTAHSLLISLPVSGYLQARLKTRYRFYRMAYNFAALLTLVPVLYYTWAIQGPVVFRWEGSWRIVQALLWIGAVAFFVAGARRYDMAQFLGLRQARAQNACSVLTDDCTLDSGGVLGMVRHPWYTGGILIIWARPLDMGAVLTNLVVSAYFVIGAYLEEGKLRVQFGADYAAYQRRVSMFLPFKWVRKKIGYWEPQD
jgi:protein-S-isoprenylcysteine O-methyltransferase Ste14